MVDGNHLQDSTLEILQTPLLSRIPTPTDENEVDDVHATRDDHFEGLWENITIDI